MRLDRWGSSVMSHRKSDGSCAFVAGKGVSPLGITVLWSCGEDFLGGSVSAPPYLEKSVRARLTMVDIRKRTRKVYSPVIGWLVGLVGGGAFCQMWDDGGIHVAGLTANRKGLRRSQRQEVKV